MTVPLPAVTFATRVSVTLAPGATFPTLQTTGGVFVPPLVADTKVSPVGTVSVMTTWEFQSVVKVKLLNWVPEAVASTPK